MLPKLTLTKLFYTLAASALAALAILVALVAHTYDSEPSFSPRNLTVTAVVGKNGISVLECWALAPSLVESTQSGVVGALTYPHLGATTANSSWSFFPKTGSGGFHNAPAPQYVIALTGQAEISFPSEGPSKASLSRNHTFRAGDILVVADTADVSKQGHNSVWQAGTSFLQLPFAGGIPPHVLLYDGGCKRSDLLH